MENLTITLTANEILMINTLIKEDAVKTMQKSVQFQSESLGESYRDLSLFQSRLSDKIIDQVAKQSKKGLEKILKA